MAAIGPLNLFTCFGRSGHLKLNKFFDPRTPSMRKLDDGEKKKEKRKEKRKEWRFQWPLRRCQQSTAQMATPERRPLERRMLVPKMAYIANFSPVIHSSPPSLLIRINYYYSNTPQCPVCMVVYDKNQFVYDPLHCRLPIFGMHCAVRRLAVRCS